MSSYLPDLSTALLRANESLSEEAYYVTVTNKEVRPKEPVSLQLLYKDGKTQARNIGIIHLVHLRGSDETSTQSIAKNTDQVFQAIMKRIQLFQTAEKQGLHIDENGTIFDFKKVAIIVNKDNTLTINGKMVTHAGKPLLLTQLRSEDVIEFRQLENGHIELFDKIDKREKKGIFINPEGEIYRG